MGEREPSHIVDGNVNWYSHYGKQYRGSFKNRTTIWSSNPTLGIYPEKMKALIRKDNTHPNVHSSTIYNRQDMETI